MFTGCLHWLSYAPRLASPACSFLFKVNPQLRNSSAGSMKPFFCIRMRRVEGIELEELKSSFLCLEISYQKMIDVDNKSRRKKYLQNSDLFKV
jgi:hypothetical protein